MIPNHNGFLEAINGRKKVCARFYSKADNGVLDRVCAPLDYGPGVEIPDGLNRYWLWDYKGTTGSQMLGLVPQQIVDMQVLGEVFDPADFGVRPLPWSIPREWGAQPQLEGAPIIATRPLTAVAQTNAGPAQPVALSNQRHA